MRDTLPHLRVHASTSHHRRRVRQDKNTCHSHPLAYRKCDTCPAVSILRLKSPLSLAIHLCITHLPMYHMDRYARHMELTDGETAWALTLLKIGWMRGTHAEPQARRSGACATGATLASSVYYAFKTGTSSVFPPLVPTAPDTGSCN